MKLDLLIENARIRTGSGRRPSATRIGMWCGRGVGVDEQLDRLAAVRVLDAEGAFLMAGFNDAHAHSVWFGQTLGEINLSGAADAEEVYRRVRDSIDDSLADDAWVVASQYDPLALSALPDRNVLDHVCGGRPLLIKHSSGHAYTVNSVALSRAGIADRPGHQPSGGAIVVDEAGRATGVLEENAMQLVQHLLLPDAESDIVGALGRATAQYAREGLTSVTDAGIGGGWIGHSPREFATYQAARDRGLLATRMQTMIAAEVLHELAGHAGDAAVQGLDTGIRSGAGDSRLQIGPMKLFLDGSLLGATAALTEPYCTCPTNRGYFQDDPDAMRARAHAADDGRLGTCTACDRRSRTNLALDIIEDAGRTPVPPRMPHRIEHGGVVRPDQLTRIAELDVSLVPQPLFIAKYGDGMSALLGPERTTLSYPAASLLRAGANLAGSSDRPVAPGAPLRIVQAFAERTTQSGALYGPQERITVEDALTAYTVGSAIATGWQDSKGTLETGKLADLVALADDPREVPVNRVGDIDVVATWVGGIPTHGGLPDAGRCGLTPARLKGRNMTMELRDETGFLADFAKLSGFGRTPGGGVDRQAATDADHATRAWWADWLVGNGFDVRTDAIGNQFGLRELVPGAPYVVLGSHLDSQPLAGRFDGAYGVLAAGHAARAVVERVAAGNIRPRLNLAVVNWFNEEGSRFAPSMMGSSVATGKLSLAAALAMRDHAGISVGDALKPQVSLAEPLPVASYCEIHIEQGRLLENTSTTIGLVDRTWAASKYRIRVHGTQGHTGATVMADRRDALYGAALLVVAARELTDVLPRGRLHSSVSEMQVLPNSPVTLARLVEMNLDLRSPDEAVLAEANRLLEEHFVEIEQRAHVTIERELTHSWGLLAYQPQGVELARDVARSLGLTHTEIMTVAGHDSTNMKDVVPTVMLFVPSIQGVSHNEAEATHDTDALAGVALLTDVAVRLVQGELWNAESFDLGPA